MQGLNIFFNRILYRACAVLIAFFTSHGLADTPEHIVTRFADQNMAAGDLVVGIDVGGSTRWIRTGDLDADTHFEIGSITKALTGLWLAAEIDAGTVSADTTIGELWPDAEVVDVSPSPALADVTLAQLATHTSGLPRLHLGPEWLLRLTVFQDNPYRGLSREDVFRDAANASIGEPGQHAYSNLGYALLGQLLMGLHNNGSEAPFSSEVRYAELLKQIVLDPLDSPTLNTLKSTLDNPPELPQAHLANGRPTGPWTFDGYVAAGGVIAQAGDLLELVRQLHDAPPRFKAALEGQVTLSDKRQIGYGWLRDRLSDGDTLIWHNGATAGFFSFAGFVPERDLTIVVLANAAVPLTDLGFAIAEGDTVAPEVPGSGWFSWAIGVAFVVLPVGYLIADGVLGLLAPRLGERIRNWGTKKAKSKRDLLGVTQRSLENLLFVGVWARVAPAVLYVRWLELTVMVSIALVFAMTLARQWHPEGRLPWVASSNRLYTVGRVVMVLMFAVLVGWFL